MDDPSPDSTAPDDTVDALLERYLVLLDEYTSLRAELSRLQTATFQHLARANFAAERGARYGADAYDERMQASRTVVVVSSSENSQRGTATATVAAAPMFQVVVASHVSAPPPVAEESSSGEAPPSTTKKPPEDASAGHGGESEGKEATTEEDGEDEEEEEKRRRRRQRLANDPLRWFGVLTPSALRQTQTCAVDAVGRVVPRLVTVDAAMRALEIEVRRARKRRAKATAAARREPEQVAPVAVPVS